MPPILIATDFTLAGPYVGEMTAVLAREAPGHPVVHLMADLPMFRPRESAYLLDALVRAQPPGQVFLCVVDPGVGTANRLPVWVEAAGHRLVGPDNGLFHVLMRRHPGARMHEIRWRPRRVSASFHGRDLFAPVAGMLARGEAVASRMLRRSTAWSRAWSEDLDRVVYVDGFGNCVTGRRADSVSPRSRVEVGAERLRRARTFGDVTRGEGFWYENSLGLLEVAVNQGSAAAEFGLGVGAVVTVAR